MYVHSGWNVVWFDKSISSSIQLNFNPDHDFLQCKQNVVLKIYNSFVHVLTD